VRGRNASRGSSTARGGRGTFCLAGEKKEGSGRRIAKKRRRKSEKTDSLWKKEKRERRSSFPSKACRRYYSA